MSHRPDTQTLREGLFRFGQWFTRTNVKFTNYRDPIANFIINGCVDDTISQGYDLVEKGTEDFVSFNDEFQEKLEDHFDEYKQTIYFHRRDGQALQSFMAKGGVLVNFAGNIDQYRLYKNAMGNPTKGYFNPQIAGYPGVPKQDLESTGDPKEDPFMELITKRKDKIGQGLSAIEPLWDVFFAVYMLVSHSAYFIARAGAGLKKATIPSSALTDTDSTSVISDLSTAMIDFGSANDTIITVEELGGVPINFEIVTVDTPIDFGLVLDYYLTVISVQTGIPQSTLKGLVPGQQEGAVVNEASYFDFQRDMQDSYRKYTKWFNKQLIKHYDLADLDYKYDLLWRVRQVISKEDEQTLLGMRLDNVAKFKNAGLKTKIAFEKSGILDISETDLKEGVDEPIMLMGPMGNNIDNNDSNDNADKTDNEEKDDDSDK